eukprot:gene30959-15138_t
MSPVDFDLNLDDDDAPGVVIDDDDAPGVRRDGPPRIAPHILNTLHMRQDTPQQRLRMPEGGTRLAVAVLMKASSCTRNISITRVLCINIDALRAPNVTDHQRRLLVRLRDSSLELTPWGTEFQKPYDVVITALGWTWDRSLLDPSVTVRMTGPPDRASDSVTYPLLRNTFEAASAPSMFVVGAAAHGLDRYRYKASGGFIHGFRFNARTLWRILEERYEVRAQWNRPGRGEEPRAQSAGCRGGEIDAEAMRKTGGGNG